VTDVLFRWGPIPESAWGGVRLRTAVIDAATYQPLQIVQLLGAGGATGQGALALVGLKAYGATNMTYTSGAVALAVNGGASTPLSFDLASFLITDDS